LSTVGWRPVTLALSYRLGELALFDKQFRGLVDSRHFTQRAPLQGLPAIPDAPDPAPDLYFHPAYPVHSAPEPLVFFEQWIAYTPHCFINYYVDLEQLGSFDAYLAQFSSKSRWTLLRKVRRFAEADGGQLHWRKFTRPSEFDEFFHLATTISANTYQQRLLDKGFPVSPAFIADMKARAERQEAMGYILFLRGEAVAYEYCPCNDGIVSYSYVGYRPSVRSLSPGTVLQYLVLGALFEQRNIRLFDFTEGEGELKRFFSTHGRLCAKTYFFRRNLKNIAYVLAHCSLDNLVSGVGRVLHRLSLKSRVRKLIRALA